MRSPAARLAAAGIAVAVVLAGTVLVRWVSDAWVGRRPLDPVAFYLGPIGVRWYGLLLALSFVPAWALAQPERVRLGLSVDELVDATLLGIPLGLVGARLGFVVQNLEYFVSHPLDILRTRSGGLSMHGVLAGVALAILLFSRRRKVSAAALADLAAPSILLAQAIGRWGNFFNHEVVGYPTQRPWGFYVPPELRPPGFEEAAFFHPAFFYESLLDGLGVVLLVRYRRRSRRRAGEVAALYFVLYGAIRFGVEWVRIGHPVALGLTLAQWVSLAMMAGGAAWWLHLRWQSRPAVVE